MKIGEQFKFLGKVFKTFIRFSPREWGANLFLSVLQGVTAGIGILMLIPLLHVIGIEGLDPSGSPVIAQLVDFLETRGVQFTLPEVLGIYVGIIFSIAVLRYILFIRTAKFQRSYNCFMRDKVYGALLNSEWQFIADHKMSGYTNILTRQIHATGVAGTQLLALISQGILLIIYMALAVILSWQMTAIVIAIAMVLFVAVYPQNKKAYDIGFLQVDGMKSIYQLLEGQLASLKMIKGFASEKYHTNLFSSASQYVEEQDYEVTRTKEVTRLFQVTGGTIAFSILFYISFAILNIPLASLIVLLLIFAGMLPKVTAIQSNIQQIMYKVSCFDEINSLLAKCLENQETPPDNHTKQLRLYKTMRLENVSFAYGGSAANILSDLNLTIHSNTTTAIAGPSGIGKTTLADLIAGLLTPSNGSIYIDDHEVTGKTRRAWRKSLAYVTQETFLFPDTVRANLSWVRKEITEADIWEALTITRVADVVKSLPEGLDTSIGDRGVKLSGGERQRLAIARALLSNPALLILDEATNALDRESEEEIHSVLHNLRGKLSIIIIDHRGAMTQSVDNIIDLSNK